MFATCRFPFEIPGAQPLGICPYFFADFGLPYTSPEEFEECLASDCSPELTPETVWEAGQIELTPPAVVLWALCCGHLP